MSSPSPINKLNSITSFLSSKNALSYKVLPSIITSDISDTPISAFKKLLNNKILSTPILEHGKFAGFIDMKDLIEFVVFAVDIALDQIKNGANVKNIEENIFDKATTEISIRYLALRHSSAYVHKNNSFYDAALFLSKGYKRVAVLNHSSEVVHIVTQSNIIGLINESLGEFNDVLNINVKEAAIGNDAISVPVSMPALEVLKLMVYRQVAGVPLVDEEGNWIATFSASDLNLFLQYPSIEKIKLPIIEFLMEMRQHDSSVYYFL